MVSASPIHGFAAALASDFSRRLTIIDESGELKTSFQDVAFLPFQACYHTMFLNNCCRGQGYCTATCFIIVVGVSEDMLPVNNCALMNPLGSSQSSWR